MRYPIALALVTLAACEDPTCHAAFLAAAHHNELGAGCGELVVTPDDAACEDALASCDDLDRTFVERLVQCSAAVDPCSGPERRNTSDESHACEARARALTPSCRAALESAGVRLRFDRPTP